MSNKEFPTGYPVGIKHYSNVTSISETASVSSSGESSNSSVSSVSSCCPASAVSAEAVISAAPVEPSVKIISSFSPTEGASSSVGFSHLSSLISKVNYSVIE